MFHSYSITSYRCKDLVVPILTTSLNIASDILLKQVKEDVKRGVLVKELQSAISMKKCTTSSYTQSSIYKRMNALIEDFGKGKLMNLGKRYPSLLKILTIIESKWKFWDVNINPSKSSM